MIDQEAFVILWDITTFIGVIVAIISVLIAHEDREHQRRALKRNSRSPVKRFSRMRLRAEVVKLYFQLSYFFLGVSVVLTLEHPDRPISYIFWVLYLGVLALIGESAWYLRDRMDIRHEIEEMTQQAVRQERREASQEERSEHQDERQIHQDVREIHQDAREIEQEKKGWGRGL